MRHLRLTWGKLAGQSGLLIAVLACLFLCIPQARVQADELDTVYNQEDDSPGNLKICSWNIRIFSNKSRTDDELKYISFLLDKCDITAIQELRDEEVLKRTVQLLNSSFNYEISGPVGNGVKERYAFLYRPDKISVVQHGAIFPDPLNRFIREPYYATFKAGNFDFTLVTIHLLFGSSMEARRKEASYLPGVYRFLLDKEKDVILLGDFNMPPTDKGFDGLKAIKNMTHVFNPPDKTTIGSISLYDNFWFISDNVKEYTGKKWIMNFDDWIFKGNLDKARSAASDHRPVQAEFKINLPDDD